MMDCDVRNLGMSGGVKTKGRITWRRLGLALHRQFCLQRLCRVESTPFPREFLNLIREIRSQATTDQVAASL